jgi:hypothetical protein
VTDWAGLTGPDGARALITARCVRCYRVAAKYWEHDNEGAWIAPNHSRTRTIEEILDDSTRVRNMVATRVCRCEPPPTLPDGDELAALVAHAHRKPAPEAAPSPFKASRITPLTIRV